MNKIKQKFNSFVTEAKVEACDTMVKIAAGDASAFSKSDRIVAGIAGGAATVVYTAQSVFGEDIIDQVNGFLKNYYGKIAGIATVLAAFCILLALLWTMISPSSQGAQTPISWVKKIIVVYILILSIGGIINLIGDVTAGQGFKAK